MILDWAAAKGLLVNDWTDENGDPYDSLEFALESRYDRNEDADGSESMIYYDYEQGRIVKSCKMEHYQNVQELLDSIALFNSCFPKTAYEILGFGYDEEGEFRVVMSQPIVDFDDENIVSEEEITEYMKSLGFVKDKAGWTSSDGRFKVYDVNLSNVIKTDGGLSVIDADAYFTESPSGFNRQEKIHFMKKRANSVSSDVQAMQHTGTINQLKPEYRGKLIYAQDGSGKSTLADNITVFDSDYLLGEVLDVSPQTARFFFNSMSAKQKEAFGNMYKKSVREKLGDGFTVLTADADLMNEADVVVYHQSAKQADERVNSSDRFATERYSA